MFARVTVLEGSPDRVDESIRHTRETILPQAKKLKGFKGLYFMIDRTSGKGMALTLWETEADLQAAAEAASRLRAEGAKVAAAVNPPQVEVFEVVVTP